MRVPGVEDALRALRETEGVRLGRGASDTEIAEAERILGVEFPPGYRVFLRRIGWAELHGLAVFGLGEDVPAELDLRRELAEGASSLSGNLLPFARDRHGATLCLDPAHSGPYESPVYRCPSGPSLNRARDYVGHDFASWLWTTLAR